jgi:rhodanese-related sulfurtransferase
MKSAAAAIVLCVVMLLAACSKKQEEHAIKTVSIAELDTMLAKGACTPVDANGPETRKNRGVIPGAIRLTDYETFAASELPADKARPLVFYCANEQCGASHEAAAKALATGHTQVKVLTAGIKGWVDAGKQVEPGA